MRELISYGIVHWAVEKAVPASNAVEEFPKFVLSNLAPPVINEYYRDLRRVVNTLNEFLFYISSFTHSAYDLNERGDDGTSGVVAQYLQHIHG